ncbi:hypothetical protein BHM03_00030297 [Ensete ventricosum]|nr:hypothetical protein BHM03_00030297 [Ensete ventricosum]
MTVTAAATPAAHLPSNAVVPCYSPRPASPRTSAAFSSNTHTLRSSTPRCRLLPCLAFCCTLLSFGFDAPFATSPQPKVTHRSAIDLLRPLLQPCVAASRARCTATYPAASPSRRTVVDARATTLCTKCSYHFGLVPATPACCPRLQYHNHPSASKRASAVASTTSSIAAVIVPFYEAIKLSFQELLSIPSGLSHSRALPPLDRSGNQIASIKQSLRLQSPSIRQLVTVAAASRRSTGGRTAEADSVADALHSVAAFCCSRSSTSSMAVSPQSKLRLPACDGSDSGGCVHASGLQQGVLNLGLYLTALGTGGLKSSVSGFGSDQFDETNRVLRNCEQMQVTYQVMSACTYL